MDHKGLPLYTQDQISEYFHRINWTESENGLLDKSDLLEKLVRRQLAHVPFETLALHYSTTKKISLDHMDLFEKIVSRRHGGYCLENNIFFGTVLRSLGFLVVPVVCRISMASRGVYDGSWRPMSHMANIVVLDDQRFLVDVGYGVDGPSLPLPLRSGEVKLGLPSQELKLEHKVLPQYQDANQRQWIYCQHRGTDAWSEVYHFAEAEFLLADFEILNHYNMTQSLWSRTVLAQNFLLDEDGCPAGTTMLLRNQLVVDNKGLRHTYTFDTETQRIEALEKYLGIRFSPEEQKGISGSPSELTGPRA